MTNQNQSNRDYSEKPLRISPLKKDGLIIYWGKDRKVCDVRAEEDALRLYPPKK